MKKVKKIIPLIFILGLVSCSSSRSTLLTFDANGGYFDGNENLTKLFSKGVINTEVPESEIKTPSNNDENKIFVGWVEENSTAILPEKLKYPYVDSIVYAYWLTKVSISYVTNIDGLSHENEIGYDGKYVTLWVPSISDEAGYVFEGWYSDPTFETKFDSKVFPSSSVSLYGLFESFPTITLHYSDNDSETYTGKAGSKISKSFKEYQVEEGETFDGWYYKTEENGAEVEKKFFFDYMPGVSLDLYPKTSAESKVKIEFDLGSDHVGSIASLTGVAGKTITEIPSMKDIDFGNYTFEGWYYYEDGIEKQFDFKVFPESDLVLHAKWSEYPTISFNTSSLSGITIQDIQLAPGEEIPTLPKLSVDGKDFLYWSYDNNGTEEKFDLKTMIETSIVLNPVFKDQKVITYKFIYNGSELTELQKKLSLQEGKGIDNNLISDELDIPSDYIVEGVYDGIYNKENPEITNEISLPYFPEDDETIYINLIKKVTINIYTPLESINPLWYLENSTLSETNFKLSSTITGGEGQKIDFDKSILSKYGYKVEGFYESTSSTDISYDKIFNLASFPYLSDAESTTKNIFVRYTKVN